jgi:hypothetical protein
MSVRPEDAEVLPHTVSVEDFITKSIQAKPASLGDLQKNYRLVEEVVDGANGGHVQREGGGRPIRRRVPVAPCPNVALLVDNCSIKDQMEEGFLHLFLVSPEISRLGVLKILPQIGALLDLGQKVDLN